MSRSRFRLAVAATLLVLEPGAAQNDVTRTGKTFVVTLHPGTLGAELASRLADEALAAAESARPVLEKLYQRPAKRATIHVYASLEEFQPLSRVRDAVCRPEKAASHVLMRPVLREAALQVVGLPESTRNEIVVQAALLTAYDRSELARSDPWSAEVFAAGVLDATVFADVRDGVDPGRDTRFWWVARLGKEGRVTLRALQGHSEAVGTPEENDYAMQCRAAVARLFASTGGGWARKLLNAQTKDRSRIFSQRHDAVEAVMGGDEKRNEERFAKLLGTCALQYRIIGPLVALRGGRILIAAGDEMAGVGGANLPPVGPYAVRAKVEIAAGDVADVAFVLDEDSESDLAFLCEPHKIVLQKITAGAKVEDLASFAAPIEVGKPFTLSLEVRKWIHVFVDGAQVGERDIPAGRTMRNNWWVGKQRGIVWLENLRCESLAAQK